MGTFIFVIICDKLDVGGNLYARIDCTEHMVFFSLKRLIQKLILVLRNILY